MGCSKFNPPMWEELQRFSALGSAARGQFLRAVVMLPLIALSLRLRGFRKTQASLERFLSLPGRPAQVSESACTDLTVRMVRAASRRTFGRPTCLEESLILWWLLRRQGIASDLRIGVRKNGEKFEAHAWVEFHGTAFHDPESGHELYAALAPALTARPPVMR